MKIIALDPGGVTGWATAQFEVTETTRPEFNQGKIEGEQHHLQLFQFLSRQTEMAAPGETTLIICEAFPNRGNVAAELISKEYIGVVELFYQMFSPMDPPLLMKRPLPAEMKWSSDVKLKALGLYISGQPAKDIRAATRHLVNHLTFRAKHPWVLQELKNKLQA